MRESYRPRLGVAAGILGALLVVVGVAVLVASRAGVAGLSPESTSRHVADALAAADLDGLRAHVAPDVHDGIVRALSRPRYERVHHVYAVVIPEIAEPERRRLRDEATELARAKRLRLLERIDVLGRARLPELNDDEVRALTRQRELFDDFVFCSGLDGLDPEDRRLIGDDDSFRHRLSEPFVVRAGWELLGHRDREVLGSPDVLRSGETPELFAFYDRYALPLLEPAWEDREVEPPYRPSPQPRHIPTQPERWRLVGCELERIPGRPAEVSEPEAEPEQEPRFERVQVRRDWASVIRDVSRSQAASFEAFLASHGRDTARQALQSGGILGLDGRVRCRYEASEEGSLLRRTSARVDGGLTTGSGRRPFRLVLAKDRLRWTVTSLNLDALGTALEG